MIGYLREWKVWKYEDVEANKGWGFSNSNLSARVTVCYHNGVLGVALRQATGQFETHGQIETVKSMYVRK